MSLRLRLLTGLAALVVLGLAVFATTTYLSVEHFLVNRLDQQLTDAARGLLRTDAGGRLAADGNPGPFGNGGPGDGPGGGRFPNQNQDEQTVRNAIGPELFVEFLAATGTAEQIPAITTTASTGVEPKLPSALLARIAAASGRSAQPPASVPVQVFNADPAGGDGPSERVAVALPASGGAIVVAGSLVAIRQTLGNLLAVEIAVAAGVLALTLGLGLVLARQATHPLEEIARTADAIAAGDMDRRVPLGRGGSETGRVARALNTMLSQIQDAFSRRDATEARLRTFVADASHELATPLTSIRGYAELFQRGLADHPEDLAKALRRIESEAARMGVLVDDLLLLASFDAGRPLAQDPVDLGRIAADAAADLAALDRDRPVSLEAASPVIVVGDEARLRQVASNLVSNLRRHTPAGTPVILRARRDATMGVLEVADRGPGMTAEQAAKVFDRFYRVDKARSRAMGGAGLGLSIIAAIAEAHGGQASVTTAPGQGATFSIAIPLA